MEHGTPPTELPDALKLLHNRLDRSLVDRLDHGDFAENLLEHLRTRQPQPLLFTPDKLPTIAALAREHDPEEFAWEREIAENAREGRLYGASNPYCRRFLELDRETFDFSSIDHFDPQTIHGLNRMRWIEALGKMHHLDGDPSYYHALQREWDFFMQAAGLPDASFFPEVSRLRPDRLMPPCSELDTFIRLRNWYWGYWLSVFSGPMTPERNAVLLARCLRHVDLVTAWGIGRHEHNFTSMQMESLYWWSTSLPEVTGMTTLQHAVRNTLEMSLVRAVFDDGAQWEKSISYHSGCIGWYGTSFLLGRRIGQPWAELYGQRLQAMGRYLDALVTPDGNAPLLSDSDRKPGWQRALSLLRCIFPDIRFRRPVGPSYASLWTGDGEVWNADSVVAEAEPVSVFEDAGVVSVLSSPRRGATQVILDNGPTHAGHSHRDNLTVHYDALGRPVVVDPGRWVYDTSPDRRWVKGPHSHNTFCIEDEPVGPDSDNHNYPLDIFTLHDPRLDVVQAEVVEGIVRITGGHRGFRVDPDAVVHRTVFTTLDETTPWLVVVDHAEGPREHTWTSSFLLPTAEPAQPIDGGLALALPDDMHVALVWSADADLSVRDDEKFWCPNYAEKSPARWVRLSSRAARINRAVAVVPRMERCPTVALRYDEDRIALTIDKDEVILPVSCQPQRGDIL